METPLKRSFLALEKTGDLLKVSSLRFGQCEGKGLRCLAVAKKRNTVNPYFIKLNTAGQECHTIFHYPSDKLPKRVYRANKNAMPYKP